VLEAGGGAVVEKPFHGLKRGLSVDPGRRRNDEAKRRRSIKSTVCGASKMCQQRTGEVTEPPLIPRLRNRDLKAI
jgi:hypothetical protein